MRFFKHLILTIFILIILGGAAFVAWTSYNAGMNKAASGGILSVTESVDDMPQNTVSENSAENSDVFVKAAEALKSGTEDEFNRLCEQNGLTAEHILAALNQKSSEELRSAYIKTAGDATEAVAETPAYTKLYPELYAEPAPEYENVEKAVYLTFDDGPSINTKHILEELGDLGVKAAFFVCPAADGSDAGYLKSIVEQGHTIGVHSATHEYETIYESVESYLADFAEASNRIEKATGVRPDVFRFPGGSVNSYNRLVYRDIVTEMTRRGYTYYDWHVDGNEIPSATPDSVYRAVVNGVDGRDRAIVLLHDASGKWQSAEAIRRIVTDLRERGYHFEQLTNRILPVSFATVW